MSRRYLRQGPGQVPTIYSGDLAGLEEVIRDAIRASKQVAGAHKVSVHEPGTLTVLKVFNEGQCLNVQGGEDDDS